MSLRVDPMQYAREREAKIERAQQIRERRKSEDIYEDERGQKMDTLFPNRVKQEQRRRRKEICPGWTQHTCKKTGRLYYHHAATNKTTWTRPAEAPPLQNEKISNETIPAHRRIQENEIMSRNREEEIIQKNHQQENEIMSRNREEEIIQNNHHQENEIMSRNREEEIIQNNHQQKNMTENEFEIWITGFVRLTPSQIRRLSTLVNAQLSVISKQEEGNLEPKQQRRHPRPRPEWNETFASNDQPEIHEETQHTQWHRKNNTFHNEEQAQNNYIQKYQQEELPPGWTKHRDKRSGHYFYRNEQKQESTWIRPRIDHVPKKKDEDRYRAMWRPESSTTKTYNSEESQQVSARSNTIREERRRPTPDLQADDAAALDDNCTQCERAMNSHALDKMQKIHGIRCCPKCAPQKKRKQFNTAARRAEAIADNPEDKQLIKSGIAAVKREKKEALKSISRNNMTGTGESKWKAQSEQLRDAMKSMRHAQHNKVPGQPPPAMVPSAPDPSLVACPHCGRRFNDKAAERHIPKCRDIKAKPRTLKEVVLMLTL